MSVIVSSSMKEIHQVGVIFGHRLLVEIEGDPKEIDFSKEREKINHHFDKMNKAYLATTLDNFIIELSNVKVTERGWAGHFIGSRYCGFRRNTLLEGNDKKIIISTIGNYNPMLMIDGIPAKAQRQIGACRTYETMAFEAKFDGTYWDIDVEKQLSFDSEWAFDELSHSSDERANKMHEKVVFGFVSKLQNNENL